MQSLNLRNAGVLIKIVQNVVINIGYGIIWLAKKITYLVSRLTQSIRGGLISLKSHRYTHYILGIVVDQLQKDWQLKKRLLSIKPPTIKIKVKKKVPRIIKTLPEIPMGYVNRARSCLSCLAAFILGIIFAVLFILIPSHIAVWLNDLPNPDLLVTRSLPTPTRILDRQGRLLYEIYIDKRYEPVKLSQIPRHVVEATIAVEDDEFFFHFGINPKSMIRAAKSTFVDDKLQGGSTITQQLIKNVLLSPERTLSRKMKELVLAIVAEIRYSKSQILELYLNNISYGGSAWGIQSASLKFFNKNVWEIDLAEAALLAGLPTAPSAYSPISGDMSIAKTRQKYVLDRMQRLGYITYQESVEAYNKELVFAQQKEYIRAPHFVAYVRKDLEEKYGRRFLELGGLTVRTTLDLDLQEKVQEIVSQEVEKSRHLNISNGAAVVLDSRTAEILAYVGSKDYFQGDWGAFDVITSLRQPGSSIKPVTYSLALERGYTAASVLKDEPITFTIKGQPVYTPKNYDGKYHGKVTLRQALSNSYNVPAVRLANELGPDNIVALGRDLGLSNWQVDGSYGLSVTLGGKEVRLLDHANLYATLARKGKYYKTTPYLSVVDGKGFEMLKADRGERQVISEETAYIIYAILSDEKSRIPAFGTQNFLSIPGKTVAVKTGTTDRIRDNFTLGYTPSFTVGVWVGNNDNSPLHSSLASGLSGAAPMWNRIMTLTLQDKSDEKMSMPQNVFTKYDEKCQVNEVFIKGTKVPSRLCIPAEDEDDKEAKKKQSKKEENE